MKRNVRRDTVIAIATINFADGSEGRIERLLFYDHQDQEGFCFSWWKENHIMPRPLDGSDEEILTLLRKALQEEKVFLGNFLVELKGILLDKRHYKYEEIQLRPETSRAKELMRAVISLEDGYEGRIERLLFGRESEYAGKEGIRFSWWNKNHFQPWPLSVTEKQLLSLLKSAWQHEVFTEKYRVELLREL
jgi:hypothetical protein